MAQEIRLWEISGNDRLNEVTLSKLNLEARIENWLEDDINVIKTTKRSRTLTFEQFTEIAEKYGVADIYSKALDGLRRS